MQLLATAAVAGRHPHQPARRLLSLLMPGTALRCRSGLFRPAGGPGYSVGSATGSVPASDAPASDVGHPLEIRPGPGALGIDDRGPITESLLGHPNEVAPAPQPYHPDLGRLNPDQPQAGVRAYRRVGTRSLLTFSITQHLCRRDRSVAGQAGGWLADQAPCRPRRPRQRIRTSRADAQVKIRGRVLETRSPRGEMWSLCVGASPP